MILSCKGIQLAFGVDEILNDVTFILEEKEKAAIVGVNGAGKTSLFRILTGEYPDYDGELIVSPGARLGYLSQTAELAPQNTIYTELETVFAPVIEQEREMRRIERDMAAYTGEELDAAMAKYAALTHAFEQGRGYEYKSRIRGVIKGLGFDDGEWEQPVGQLSGGQKTRLSLGKLLLSEPDILLLDEPTNHLDIESTEWLEDFLKTYNGSVLLISHDRYFLDRVVGKVIEIENKKAKVYMGNYTSFAAKKVVAREVWLKHYIDQQKEIKRQEEIIRTLKSYNTEKSIKRAESREKMLDKMEKVERPESLPDKIRIMLKPRLESGNDVLYADGVTKSFDGQLLFENLSFDIKKGDKAALVGPNGIGKTTLFKIIMEELEADRGKLRRGANVRVGYYDQEHENLSGGKSIFNEISDAYPKLQNGQIRNVLAAFVFTGDDVFKPVSALSGGEKGRVALAKIMLGGANFLILDEPTNHLDVFSKEVLEEALRDFPGTVLYISHDRYFINNTAEKILEFGKTGIKTYLGNYDYYMEKKAEEKKENPTAPEEKSTAREERERKKGSLSEERKRKNRFEKLEKEIEQVEQKIGLLDERLAQEEVYTDPVVAAECYDERVKLEEALAELYEEWGSLAEDA